MRKKELVKILNEHVSENLLRSGYEPYQNGNEIGWIRRRVNGDLYFISFGYIPAGGFTSGFFIIEPFISIVIKEVEDVVRLIANDKDKSELKFRTFAFNLAYLEAFSDGIIKGTNHPRYNWLIEKEESISFIADRLKQRLDDIALPWIDSNANVAMVDKLLNDNLKSFIIYSPSIPDRAMRGIIAGKLIKRTNLRQVVAFYDSAIRKCSAKIQMEYNDLKSFLFSVPLH